VQPDPQTERKPRSRHREMIAAVVSGFVGFVALATSTYNVYLQRQQVRAAVWPRLVLDTTLLKNEGFSITLANRGVGPAEVKRLRVFVDGKPAVDWRDAVSQVLDGKLKLTDLSGLSPISDQIVSPGLEIKALRIASFEVGSRVIASKKKLAIELCYCSTLDECWVVGSPGNESTRPIDKCVPDAKPFEMLTDQSMAELLAALAEDAGAPPDGAKHDPHAD
jgi:hypothetical protein